MAEDDAKGRATRKPRTAKKPPAKSAPASAQTAKTRAKAATNPAAKSAAKSKAETVTAPPSGLGRPRPLPLGILGGLAVLTILAAIVFAWPGTRDRLAGMLSGPEQSTPVAVPKPAADAAPWGKFGDRLGALEGSLARLGADITALKSTPTGEMQAIGQRLTVLEARPGRSAETDAALAGIEKRLAALTESVKAMEARLGQAPVASDAVGSLALLALAGALRRGIPHGAFVARARVGIAKSDAGGGLVAGLDALAAYAAKGVPTRSALAVGLEALPLPAPKTDTPPAKSAPKPKQPAGFWDKVKANFLKLVKIRRTSDHKAPVPDVHTLARAAAAEALAKGDLAAAAQASIGLTGPEAEAWRKDLRARIKADGIAAALDGVIARRLVPKADKP